MHNLFINRNEELNSKAEPERHQNVICSNMYMYLFILYKGRPFFFFFFFLLNLVFFNKNVKVKYQNVFSCVVFKASTWQRHNVDMSYIFHDPCHNHQNSATISLLFGASF